MHIVGYTHWDYGCKIYQGFIDVGAIREVWSLISQTLKFPTIWPKISRGFFRNSSTLFVNNKQLLVITQNSSLPCQQFSTVVSSYFTKYISFHIVSFGSNFPSFFKLKILMCQVQLVLSRAGFGRQCSLGLRRQHAHLAKKRREMDFELRK